MKTMILTVKLSFFISLFQGGNKKMAKHRNSLPHLLVRYAGFISMWPISILHILSESVSNFTFKRLLNIKPERYVLALAR